MKINGKIIVKFQNIKDKELKACRDQKKKKDKHDSFVVLASYHYDEC